MKLEYAVVGRGLYTKESLVEFLSACGLYPNDYVREVEKRGRVDCGMFKILRVR